MAAGGWRLQLDLLFVANLTLPHNISCFATLASHKQTARETGLARMGDE